MWRIWIRNNTTKYWIKLSFFKFCISLPKVKLATKNCTLATKTFVALKTTKTRTQWNFSAVKFVIVQSCKQYKTLTHGYELLIGWKFPSGSRSEIRTEIVLNRVAQSIDEAVFVWLFMFVTRPGLQSYEYTKSNSAWFALASVKQHRIRCRCNHITQFSEVFRLSMSSTTSLWVNLPKWVNLNLPKTSTLNVEKQAI